MNDFNPYHSPSYRPVEPAAPKKPLPIGGWLILLAIGLTLSPLAILAELANTHLPLFTDGTFAALDLTLEALVVYEVLVNLAFVAAGIWLLVVMLRKSRIFPRAMIVFLWIRVATVLIDEIVTSHFVEGQDLEMAFNLTTLVQPTIMAALWSLYLARSKRVARTFVV